MIDANKLPPYLPERKGYITLQFKNRVNGVMEDIGTITVYFEVENNRLKKVTMEHKRSFPA